MPQPTSIEDLNATTAAAPASLRMVMTDDGLQTETRWHPEYGGNAALAAMARETIELLANPEALRRCANPNCSMLFLAEHRRRQFCIGTRCGNRTRVARHYQKAKQS
jgi:predicted RNA-binding Zn ribbon-like protein